MKENEGGAQKRREMNVSISQAYHFLILSIFFPFPAKGEEEEVMERPKRKRTVLRPSLIGGSDDDGDDSDDVRGNVKRREII